MFRFMDTRSHALSPVTIDLLTLRNRARVHDANRTFTRGWSIVLFTDCRFEQHITPMAADAPATVVMPHNRFLLSSLHV